MNQLNPNKTGLALGTLFGGLHLLWSLLVAFGWAKALLDFIFMVHMVKALYTVESFNISLAVMLVVVTAIVGYIIGNLFAMIWNRVHQQ